MEIKSGDLIFFSGQGPVSDLINLGSLGIPRYHFSHVGICCYLNSELLVYESTSLGRPPCYRQGVPVSGVQAHPLDELLEIESAKMWVYRLRSPLYDDEEWRLLYWLEDHIGRYYDFKGAGRSGPLLLRSIASVLRPEDLTAIFCSELCAGALNHVGRFDTWNASKYSPNRLARALRWRGLVGRPVRLPSLKQTIPIAR